MGVVSPVFRMENVTAAPFVLQLAQSWTVVPRSTFGELPVRFLPLTFRFRVLEVMGSLSMITLFNCEPLTSSRAYHLWVPSALSTLYPSAVSFRIFFHVAPSANVNVPITAGYFDPASSAPSKATTLSMLAVVVSFVLLRVVVIKSPLMPLTVTVPLMEWPFRSSPVSCVPSMV